MTRLLDCLITLGLLAKEQDRYRLAPGSEVLSARHPGTIQPMLLHLSHIWKNWSRLTETVREGKNPDLKRIVDSGGEVQEAFIGAMHAVGQELAAEVAAAYDLSPYTKLLDIGGASGTYTMAFLRRNPAMRAVIFDFAPVLALAKKRLAEEGFLDRVELVAGDFYQDELPGGCDLALLSAIIHQNNREQNIALYEEDTSGPGARRGGAHPRPHHGREPDPAGRGGHVRAEYAGQYGRGGHLYPGGGAGDAGGGGLRGGQAGAHRGADGLPG